MFNGVKFVDSIKLENYQPFITVNITPNFQCLYFQGIKTINISTLRLDALPRTLRLKSFNSKACCLQRSNYGDLGLGLSLICATNILSLLFVSSFILPFATGLKSEIGPDLEMSKEGLTSEPIVGRIKEWDPDSSCKPDGS